MAENNREIQKQINELNTKLDLVLEHVNQQRLKREMTDDLFADLSIVARDAWDTTVSELDDQGIEMDMDDIKQLIFKFIKNIKNFNDAISFFESMNDMIKDAAPIVNEMGIDAIKNLHEFENKGYFNFMREVATVTDRIVTGLSAEDMRRLSDNAGEIVELLRNLTDPGMVRSMNKMVMVMQNMTTSEVEEYGLWKTLKAMNSKDMRKAAGFMMTFVKKMNDEQAAEVKKDNI